MRGIVRNVDESRGAEIANPADLDTPPWPISVFVFVSVVVIGGGFAMVKYFCVFADMVFFCVFCCSSFQ